MYINYKVKNYSHWKRKLLQKEQINELEHLGVEIYSSPTRKIFKVSDRLVSRIKWHKPTNLMVKTLTMPRTHTINTGFYKYTEHYDINAYKNMETMHLLLKIIAKNRKKRPNGIKPKGVREP